MIVTCPSCTTRYLVDPAAIGADGRRVRCVRCDHSWWQDAPPPDPQPPPASTVEDGVRPLPPGSNLPARLPPPRPKGRGPALVAAILLVAGLAVLAYLARGPIVAWWPGARDIYDRLGIPPDAGDGAPPKTSQLNLTGVVPTRTVEAGIGMLRISGRVVSDMPTPDGRPELTVEWSDVRGTVLRRETIVLGDEPLTPGLPLTFAVTLRDLPAAATSVRLSAREER
jgi:predicted Zn finger-like uncharacterized protein